MIVCKSNICELADNLQFAIDHDVGLNLSPVVLYPVTEQLNCFSEFESETLGWEEAIERAFAIALQAKAGRKVAVARVDPSGMIAELRRILEEARSDYGTVAPLVCEIRDPYDSIRRMRRPAIIAYDIQDVPRAYVKLRFGDQDYVLNVPRRHIGMPTMVRIEIVHDVMEPNGVLAVSRVPVGKSGLRVYMPRYEGSERSRTSIGPTTAPDPRREPYS